MRTTATVISGKNGKRRVVDGKAEGDVYWIDWKLYSFGAWFQINHEMYEDEYVVDEESGGGKKHKERKVHMARFPRLIVKHLLEDTNLVEGVQHNGAGELREECLDAIMSVKPPKLIDRLIMPLQSLTDIDEEEEKQMRREAMTFFQSSSGGVQNPCVGIHFHAILSGLWEHYGLNYFDLQAFPAEIGVRLKAVLGLKAQVSQMEASKPKAPLPSATGGRGGRATRRR